VKGDEYWEHTAQAVPLGSLLAGPLAWFVTLQVNYTLVKWTCASRQLLWLFATPAAAMAVVLIGVAVTWRHLQALRDATPTGGRRIDRSLLLAVAALSLHGISGLLIAVSAAVQFILSPCD
jgi:hypothetical protein